MKATLSSSFKSIAASKSLALDKKLNGGSARALLNSLYLYHAGSNISNYLRLETDFKANRAELQRYIPKVELPEECKSRLLSGPFHKAIDSYLLKQSRKRFIDDRNAGVLDNFVSLVLDSSSREGAACKSRCYNLLGSSATARTSAQALPPLLVGWDENDKGSARSTSVHAIMDELPRFIHFAHPSNARNDSGRFTAIPDLVLEISVGSKETSKKTEARKRLVMSAFEVREPGVNLIDQRTLTRIFMYSLYLTKFNILELTGQVPDALGNSCGGTSKSLHEVLAVNISPTVALDAIAKGQGTNGGTKPETVKKARLPEVFLFFAASGLQVQVSFLRTRDLLYASNEYFSGEKPQADKVELGNGKERQQKRILPLYLYGPQESSIQNHSFNVADAKQRVELATVIYQTQKQFELLLCKPEIVGGDLKDPKLDCGCS